MKKYTKWTKELLQELVKTSDTYAECLRKMGLRAAGGNFDNLRRNIEKFNLDTSHMTHKAFNEGHEFKPFEGLIKPAGIKKRLLKELGHQCQKCLTTVWCNEPVPLELEHIDGNNRNNDRENLTLLCCNCHALTPTWRNRKR